MTKEHATEKVRNAMGKLMDALTEYSDAVGNDNLSMSMRYGVSVLSNGISIVNEALD